VKGVAFPPTNGSVGGANIEGCVTVGTWLAKHVIERVGRTVANQIVGGRLEIKAIVVEGRIGLAILRAWYRTSPLHCTSTVAPDVLERRNMKFVPDGYCPHKYR
jgi:hypothetical protein